MTRLLLIPMFAVLALATVPALAQYPARMPQAQPVAPIPQPQAAPEAANPAPVAATPSAAAAAAAAGPNPAVPAVPPPNCTPPEYPGSLASNNKVVAFNRDYKIYGDCVKKYVEGNRAWVNAVIDMNNKAVEDYNKYTAELKKLIDAAKE